MVFISHLNAKPIEPLIQDWQKQLRQAHDFDSLNQLVEITDHASPNLEKVDLEFRTRAPEAFVQRIHKTDPNDPLLRQILPSLQELDQHSGGLMDPVGDQTATKVEGLLHKYEGRVLLITTGACAIHCRYCFRRHFPYADSHIGGKHLKAAIDYINADESIKEVILSGGDPLMLSNKALDNLIAQIEAIPHITRLRIHTRMPVVLPDRIDIDLLQRLDQTTLHTVVVIHANHANEIDNKVQSALEKIDKTGTTLLNQSVLLKGVNDNINTLLELSERLFECKTLPYYLHMLDRVQGALHFEVEEAAALALMQQLQSKLPGYLVPKLVRELSGETSKTPIYI